MPELPEVETLARQLRQKMIGLVLSQCIVRREDYLGSPANTMIENLPGKKITGINRFGKYLNIVLSHDLHLWVHLGMTGQLLWKLPSDSPSNHDHVIFHFKQYPQVFWFRDPRRFGELRMTRGDETPPLLRSMGPDALEISEDEFFARLKPRTGLIKHLLLDQKLIAGLGNIYVSESLYLAGIRPDRRASGLKQREVFLLLQRIRKILRDAIKAGGSSIDDYVHTNGRSGRYQSRHQVYGRDGQHCFLCGAVIRRVVMGGRSSFFCPSCQK